MTKRDLIAAVERADQRAAAARRAKAERQIAAIRAGAVGDDWRVPDPRCADAQAEFRAAKEALWAFERANPPPDVAETETSLAARFRQELTPRRISGAPVDGVRARYPDGTTPQGRASVHIHGCPLCGRPVQPFAYGLNAGRYSHADRNGFPVHRQCVRP